VITDARANPRSPTPQNPKAILKSTPGGLDACLRGSRPSAPTRTQLVASRLGGNLERSEGTFG
jgi:hypothetical protein